MKVGPRYKIAKRLGESVFPKTETPKFAMSKARRGGRRGKGWPKMRTEYGNQLIEKQKIRYTYNITEKQLVNYVRKAEHIKGSKTQEHLYDMLEMRLDNVVYRAGLVPSRQFSRQVVSHGHICVNGKRVRIPSFQVKEGDVVSVREQSKGNGVFADAGERSKQVKHPNWLSVDTKKFEIKITGKPQFEDRAEVTLDFNQVIGFYSRV